MAIFPRFLAFFVAVRKGRWNVWGEGWHSQHEFSFNGLQDVFFLCTPSPSPKSAVPYIPFISLSWDTFQFCSRTENMFILASLGKIAWRAKRPSAREAMLIAAVAYFPCLNEIARARIMLIWWNWFSISDRSSTDLNDYVLKTKQPNSTGSHGWQPIEYNWDVWIFP